MLWLLVQAQSNKSWQKFFFCFLEPPSFLFFFSSSYFSLEVQTFLKPWKLLVLCLEKNMIFHAFSVATAELELLRKNREKNWKAKLFWRHQFSSRRSSAAAAAMALSLATLYCIAATSTTIEVVFERLKLFCFRFPIVSSRENWRNVGLEIVVQQQAQLCWSKASC